MKTTKFQIPTTFGEKLAGMVLQNDEKGKKPVVLVIHGWTSSMSRYPKRVQPLVDLGYLCVLFDMRGHGSSDGDLANYSPNDHLNDCLAAYDYMVSLPNADVNSISVFGSSYGGYLASLVTAERKVHHLVLRAPAQYPDELFEIAKLSQDSDEVRLWRQQHHTPENNRTLKAVHDFTGDILMMESEFEEKLPKQVMTDYLDAMRVKPTHFIIPGADHACTTPSSQQAFITKLGKWFEEFEMELDND